MTLHEFHTNNKQDCVLNFDQSVLLHSLRKHGLSQTSIKSSQVA